MGRKRSSKTPADSDNRVVARNRRARYLYEIFDELECGIVLVGSEVKSIRDGKISINESFARVVDGELWLFGATIAEYPQANVANHEPGRQRKLLVHSRQLKKFAENAQQQGRTLIPLQVHLAGGRVKVQLAVARGRKLYDKRDKLKARDARREIDEMS